MDYVKGSNLKDVLEKGSFVESQALRVLHHLARALEAAAKINLVHRDIKPENMIMNEEKVIKLVDFGMVKQTDKGSDLTQENYHFGTPYYAAPELILGKPIDFRSDQYSLGACFFHFITGTYPYQGNHAMDVMGKHLYEKVPDPKELKPDLQDCSVKLAQKMMAKSPGDRFQNPEELLKSN